MRSSAPPAATCASWAICWAAAPRDRATPPAVVATGAEDGEWSADPLLDAVADALAALRLAGHEPTERTVARDLIELGLVAHANGGADVGTAPSRRPLWRRMAAKVARR